MNIIKDLPPYIADPNMFVAVDVEMFEMDKHQLHRPNSGFFGCLTICFNENDVYIVFDEKDVPRALERIEDSIWTGHNFKFDIVQLRRYAKVPPRKRLWDTLIMERILYGGYYDFFGLDHLARRYLGIYVDKTVRDKFADTSVMTDEMIEYACRDSLIQRQVALEQKKHVDKNDFKIYQKVDHPAMWATLDYRGFPIDVKKWEALAELNKARQEKIDEDIPFNPRSWQQAKAYYEKNGWKGIPNTQEKTIIKWTYKKPDCDAARMAELVGKSRSYGKLASTYGMKLIEDYVENELGTDIIHADYDVNLAETGREASRNPNLQNIPSRETTEFRECFIPYPGEKIIVADYSSQEPRISAYISQDKHMIEIFKKDLDLYIEQGRKVFGIEITRGDKRRSLMKDTLLGMTYGLSKYGLAERHGISTTEAEALLKKTFRLFAELDAKMNELAQNSRMVETVWGRKIWLNPYSNQCARNARNSPIQGTAADMMKRAKAIIHQEWDNNVPEKVPFGMVNMVHDEIVLSVPEMFAEEIGQWVSSVMVQVAEEMLPGIPAKADYKICDNWGEGK